jgi:rhomboid protease GluP
VTETPHAVPDGDVDYNNYNETQLTGALQRIDAEKYPKNHANLIAALAAYRARQEQTPRAAAIELAVTFAPEAGPMTWLGPSRNDFRLVGSGKIYCDGDSLVITGRRFGFIFGLPLMNRLDLNVNDIVNVEIEANVVRMDCRKAMSMTVWLADAAAAQTLGRLLPSSRTPEFVAKLAAHLEFEAELLARSPRLPVTYGIAALCLLVFVVTAVQGGGWFTPSGLVQMDWGSNFGPFTMDGEWWRLLTYSFVHFGLLHLVFNLWALVSFGAIAERLFGSLRYAVICVVSGVAGGLVSIVVHPERNSAGASALILGILGALLAAQLRGAESIPTEVARSFRNSTLIFAVCALTAGLAVPGIDNAAHVGGLAAGFLVAWLLADDVAHFIVPSGRLPKLATAVSLTMLFGSLGVVIANRVSAVHIGLGRYWRTALWFEREEAGAVSRWVAVTKAAKDSSPDDLVMAKRIETDVLPFWREASTRLNAIDLPPTSSMYSNYLYLRSVADGRHHALELCVSGLRQHDSDVVGNCMQEMGRVDTMIRERKPLSERRSN